ncbi:MAG TPA: exodeoxyribonuclease VII large subunit [Verrucomicrobiae bacterium]
MAKPVKSQWDFGELFPPEQVRKVLSVTELTGQIRRLLEKEVGEVWVTGEVTNLRAQASGHIYFTLKDAGAQLNCVLFRGEIQLDRSLLQDGRKVILRGELTVYEPRGQYQLRVVSVELHGIGALQAAFEKLKGKLKAEGLFASERKRPIPEFPARIGLVTSETGAAIRDVLHVVQRRNPSLQIVLAPCRVQGDGAAAEIATAIRLLNEFHAQQIAAGDQGAPLGLILVTRGGGSLEDLWAFNEEAVARAIFHSILPVVSAVGHEIDFTISDFVADLRAATPSAAAEIITEGVYSSVEFVWGAGERMSHLFWQGWEDKTAALDQMRQRLGRLHPRRRVDEWLQRLDDLQTSLRRCASHGARQQRVAFENLATRLARVRPGVILKQRSELLRQATQRLSELARHRAREAQNRWATLNARLRLLGPEQVLARGYSITMDSESGAVLRDAAQVKAGQRLKTRLKAGEVQSRVEKEHSPK